MKEIKELIKRLDTLKLTEREYLDLLFAGIRDVNYIIKVKKCVKYYKLLDYVKIDGMSIQFTNDFINTIIKK